MDNIDIPAHQPHLKVENSWVGTIIRKDEFDCIAVSCPYKSLSKEHMAAPVDGPVTGKALTKMRVKTNLVSVGPPSTKSNRMEDSCRWCCHKIEVRAALVCVHCCSRRIIVARLTDNIAKSLGQEVCSEDYEVLMVEPFEAGVG